MCKGKDMKLSQTLCNTIMHKGRKYHILIECKFLFKNIEYNDFEHQWHESPCCKYVITIQWHNNHRTKSFSQSIHLRRYMLYDKHYLTSAMAKLQCHIEDKAYILKAIVVFSKSINATNIVLLNGV